jgi:hypothetical protein
MRFRLPARPNGRSRILARLPARLQVQGISPGPDRTLPAGQALMLATLTRG